MFLYVNIQAQTNYFSETRTFHEDGFTFQADFEQLIDALLRSASVRSTDIDMSNPHGNIVLYNKNNQFTYVEQAFRDGSRINERDGWEPPVEENVLDQIDIVSSIVRDALSSEERQRIVKDIWRLRINVFFSSDTGEVMEVDFGFDTASPFATIPVSAYREIELGIKSQLKVTPTEFGRRLNFIQTGFSFPDRINYPRLPKIN
jgi:hypothetical protein